MSAEKSVKKDAGFKKRFLAGYMLEKSAAYKECFSKKTKGELNFAFVQIIEFGDLDLIKLAEDELISLYNLTSEPIRFDKYVWHTLLSVVVGLQQMREP